MVLFWGQCSTGRAFSPPVVLFLAQSSTGKPFSPPLGDLFLLLWFCFWPKAALGNMFLLLWLCFWLKAALGNLFLLLETLSLNSTGKPFSPPVVLFLAQSRSGKPFSPPPLGNIFLLLWFCFGPKQHWDTFFSSCGVVFWPKAALGNIFLLLETLSLN